MKKNEDNILDSKDFQKIGKTSYDIILQAGNEYLNELLKTIDSQRDKTYKLFGVAIALITTFITYFISLIGNYTIADFASKTLMSSSVLGIVFIGYVLINCFKNLRGIKTSSPGHRPYKLSSVINIKNTEDENYKSLINDLIANCELAIEQNLIIMRTLHGNNLRSLYALALIPLAPILTGLLILCHLI